MSRVVKIQKVGKSTIVESIEGSTTSVVHVFNKLTNLSLRNNCIQVVSDDIRLNIQYDELFDKLGSTDIKDYLHKSAAIFLFNQ